MKNEELIQTLAWVHNEVMEISVKGDDAVRVANILTRMRGLVHALKEQEAETPSKARKE